MLKSFYKPEFNSEVFMEKILLFIFSFIIFILLLILTNYLFDRFKIREKYFKIVAKNKYIYYLLKFILSITFVAIFFIAFIKNELSLYCIGVLYICLDLSLYGSRRLFFDWKTMKKIYIDKYDEIEKTIEKNNKHRF